jgi:hypothetical protein
MLRKFTDLLTHPAFIALVLSILVIPFLPVNFSKYIFVEALPGKEAFIHFPTQKVIFSDLDGDGNSNLVRIKNNVKGSGAFVVYDNQGKVYDQYNLDRMKLDISIGNLLDRMYIGDYDGNGEKELYFFGTKNDSVFLHVEEPLNHDRVLISRMFITTVDLDIDKKPSFRCNIFGLKDMNNDRLKDFTFSIDGNFNVNKRFVACVDIKNKKIRKTQNLHFALKVTEITEIDNDNKNEVFIRSWAPNNGDSTLPFSDTKAWFTVLNDTLGFQYPPIGLPSRYGNCSSIAIGSLGHYTILADYENVNGFDRSLLVYDTVTHKLEKTLFKNNIRNAVLLHYGKQTRLLVQTKENKSYLISSPDSIQEIKLSFLIGSAKGAYTETRFRGKKVFLLQSMQPKGLLLLNNHLKKLAFLPLKEPVFTYVRYHFWRIHQNKKVQLLINTETQVLLFNIKKNPYYYIWPLIYLAVFGFFLGLVSLISFSQRQRLKKKQELENKMLRLQLITLKGQMRPHFIFNALNSIMANINLGQQEIAYKYLGKFSRLLRMLYSEEEKLAVSLERELEFVKNYLEIEHLRFKEEFSFEINVDKNADTSVQIPRMLIQIFVENAIKHGIRQIRRHGHIKIRVYREKSLLIIEVEDNGIGRKAASRIKRPYDTSGYGLKVIDDMIAMHKKQTGIQLKYRYVDLYTPEGKPAGTRVVIEVFIPKENKK